MFDRFFEADTLFGARFAHLIDKVFQKFARDLSKFHSYRRPIKAARRDLEGSMKRDLDRALHALPLGSMPNLVLPPALLEADSNDKISPREGNKPSQDKKKRKDKPAKNPHPVADWALPKGKPYGSFFNPRSEKLRENTQNWPRFPHHIETSRERNLCVRYQVEGECKEGCWLSHVDPDSMSDEVKASIKNRLQLIYKQ